MADLPISIFVTTQPSTASTAPSNATADPYDAIFCSYSHKDTAIVERVERAYKALGIDYLRDVTTLRSGEEWNPRLLAMIDEADIFQLFWSNASAESRYVQQEWEHALSLGRSGAFIRPVYWQQPMPKAPEKLSHLHFHFDPELADSR
ncbi:MAG: toll/interleukin-1 receptor domain-containing protein [Anaerolineae bacterium]